MQHREQISLPTFYARQYTTKLSTSEEILIFRWLQYLAQHRQLYAVKNKHQCFGHTHTTAVTTSSIIQPFASVDYFFGCLECGKYHLCRLKRDTCEVAIDSCDTQQICRYSGRPLLEQDNLELTFEDSTHFDHEATHFSTHGRKSLTRYEVHTQQNKKRKRKGDPLIKRRQLIDLFKEAYSDKGATHRKKRARINHLEYMASLDEVDAYEISIDSLEEDEGDEKDVADDEKCEINDDDDDDDEDTHEDKKGRDEESGEDDEAVNELRGGGDGGNDDDKQDGVLLIGDEEDDEGEWGDSALMDDVNGDGRHTKNYHNNIKHMNEYYSFLRGTLTKQARLAIDDDDTPQVGAKKNVFFEMCNRDIREETPTIETTTATLPDTIQAIKMQPLSPGVCTQIEDETRDILTLLISVNGPRVKKKDSLALLMQKFVPLIENITLLVYHSPVINRHALIRDMKNHNQSHNFSLSSSELVSGGGGGGGDNTKNMRSEQIISPQKMCRTLLLHTLANAFSLHDDFLHRIGIWQPDPWLRRFNNMKMNRVLIRDFFSLYDMRATSHGDLHTFRREIMDTSVLVGEALEFYGLCPLWLRHRVFKLRAK